MKWLLGILLGLTVAISLSFAHLQPAQSAAGCDPAYPEVCIPSPPPDLDCRDIQHRNFKVLPPDPHRFDRDKDGLGCERKPARTTGS